MAWDIQLRNVSTHFFSFQDAIPSRFYEPSTYSDYQDYKTYNTVVLYNDGCGPDRNCTQACQDPTVVFSSMYVLHNCVFYPVVSSLVLAGNVSKDSIQVANAFGITGHSNITSEIEKIVSGCIDEYCVTVDSTKSNCNNGVYNIPITSSYEDYWHIKDICSSPPANVNPDIGGPGVTISYVMQSCIALVAWVMLRYFESWTRITAYLFLLRFGPRHAWRRAQDLQKRVQASRQRAALLSALVDFQKAQCFFALAVQAAALTAIWNTASNAFQASNWQQLFNNTAFIGIVAMNGFLPVTLVLFNLHYAGMRSWYVFILSTCTVAMSGITFFSSRQPQPTNIRPLSGQQCGGHPWPVAYCYAGLPFDWSAPSTSDGTGLSAFVFCCIIIVFLLVDIYTIFRRTDEVGCTLRVNGYDLLRHRLEQWRMWKIKGSVIIRISTSVLFILIQLGFFLWILNSITDILDIAGHSDNGNNWTFGQIVAVSVWAPSVIEYMYFAFFGIEVASEYRIPKPYRVVKSDQDGLVISHIKSNHSLGSALSQSGVRLALIGHERSPKHGDNGTVVEVDSPINEHSEGCD